MVWIWDWQAGRSLLRWASGHHNNVFQARIMPESHNKTVVSCAADGQVRVAHLREGGGRIETRRLARHQGRAHKLAIEPGSPACFYSCGEDGEVRHFDLREPAAAAANRRLLVCRAAAGRPLELNSIHCNPRQPCQFVVGGADEQCRVYDQRKPSGSSASLMTVAQPVRRLSPRHLRSAGRRDAFSSVHVTCAVFSQSGEVLATYNDEDIYLFATEGSWRRGDAGAAGRAGQAQRSSGGRAQPDAAANGARSDRQGSGSRGSNKRGRGSAQVGTAEGASEGGEAAGQDEDSRRGQTRRRGAARPASYLTKARRASALAAGAAPAVDATAGARAAAAGGGAAGEAGSAAAAAHARIRAGLFRDAEVDDNPASRACVVDSAAGGALRIPEQQQQPEQQRRRRQGAWEGGEEGCGPAAPGAGGPGCSTDAAWLDRQRVPAPMSTEASAEAGAWAHASGAAPAPETPVAPVAAGHTPYRDARCSGGSGTSSQALPDGARQRPSRMVLPPPLHTAGPPADNASSWDSAVESSERGQAVAEGAGGQVATQPGAWEQQWEEGGEGFVGPPPLSGSEAGGEGEEAEMRGQGEDWHAELMQLAYGGGTSGTPSWDQDTDGSGSVEEDSSEADAEDSEDEEEQSAGFEGDEEDSEGERQGLAAAGALLDDSEAEDEAEGADEEEGEGVLGPSFGSLEDEVGDDVVMKYTGHRNSQTVKGVNFMGWHDEWVVSGSDCGHVFIWDKKTGKLGAMVKGDRHVVNCLEPHPYHTLLLATSGIEDDIKLWAPTAAVPRQPGAEAEEVMHANTAHRGRSRRRMVITPQLLRLLLGERLEVRRQSAQAGGGVGAAGGMERAERGEGDDSEAGEGGEEGEEEGEESERELLLHVDGSDEEDGAEALRRIAPGECSLM
ncbi:hypothetical protein N2152v2_007432 [Parachlorella kessleri]